MNVSRSRPHIKCGEEASKLVRSRKSLKQLCQIQGEFDIRTYEDRATRRQILKHWRLTVVNSVRNRR